MMKTLPRFGIRPVKAERRFNRAGIRRCGAWWALVKAKAKPV